MRAGLATGEPVVSVGAKKKELVGEFKNAGRAQSISLSAEALRDGGKQDRGFHGALLASCGTSRIILRNFGRGYCDLYLS